MRNELILTDEHVELIASVAHEANRAYCESIGDASQPKWGAAPDWQKISATKGVRFMTDNNYPTARVAHTNWFKNKLKNGWVYGEIKDPEKKTHPCMVEYDKLPLHQQIKDHIFRSVVVAMITRSDLMDGDVN